MRLPAQDRNGLVKLPFGPTEANPSEAFTEGKKGRLYFRFPHLRPGAVDATVQQIDRDRAVFRLTGPIVAPPPLDTIPKERQVPLAGAWLWTWDESDPKYPPRLRPSSAGPSNQSTTSAH